MQSIQTSSLWYNVFCCYLIIFSAHNVNSKRLDDGYYDISTYTNCNGLDDGYYDIEVIPDHTLNILCSNEYMIIDILHDSKWVNMLSSYKQYDKYIIGPLTNDHVNWVSFIPSLEIDHYLVSPDCSVCDETSYLNNGLYGDNSAYYMNQIASGCFHKNRGLPACDMDPNTYVCKICEWTEGTVLSRPYNTPDDYNNDENTGICSFSIKPSNFIVATDFSQCLNYQTSAFKPSLGTNGKYCQCIKTDATNGYNVRKIKTEKMIIQIQQQQQQQQQDSNNNNDIIYLYQSDFYYGTYRITKGGTYIIMEDIEFDFNSNINKPNSEGAYMPQCNQINKYPGACSQSGPYFLGFFSGITIETKKGVILDLNEHSIGMSKSYYFQQGYFSIIELGSQPFLPMHGPGNFGVNPVWAENVIIKNGILRLSSHHGIHGNNNKNIKIYNIKISQFVTHGIQLNGFSDITIKNIDIGPSNNIIKLNGNYVQMRALLNNLRTLYKKKDILHKQFSFAGRKNDKITLEELVENRLIPIMDKAFKWAISDNIDVDNIDKEINIFINNNNNFISYGATVYGLFLNYPGSGIFGWHVNQDKSNGALIENINIHDLYHNSEEIIGLTTNKHGISNVFNGPLSLIDLVGKKTMEEIVNVIQTKSGEFHASYVGNIITDIHLSYYYLSYNILNDWDMFPGTPYYGDDSELVKWAFGDDPYYENVISSDRINSEQQLNELVTCNGDIMQHPLKGIIGIKLSGISNVQFKGYININNFYDSSQLGSTLCGAYTKANFGQQLPYSFGFSGNMIHGMDIAFSDVIFDLHQFKINNLISDTGLSYGLSTWYNTYIQFNNDIDFSIMNIQAGNKYLNDIPSNNEMIFKAPNHKPQACGIRIHQNTIYPVTISFGSDESIFRQQCIIGIIGCEEDIKAFTHIGTVNNMECQDLRNNRNNDDNNGQDILTQQQMIHNVHYFSNVFIMILISVIVLSVFALYYWCCFTDKNTQEIDKYHSNMKYNAYGSLY